MISVDQTLSDISGISFIPFFYVKATKTGLLAW